MFANREPMPAGFFGMAVGTLALAGAWRVGVKLWHLPADVALFATVAALVVWVALMAGYAIKWRVHRDAALAEWRHPVQSSFVALAPVSTMLAAQAVLAWSRPVAIALFVVGAAAQLAVGVALHGRLWQGGRAPETITPAIYLPTVAPGFVAGTTAAALGWTTLGQLFFGAGLIAWLTLESVILQRGALADPIAAPLRPTLGIQLAPPVVGGVSWLAVTAGAPNVFAYALLGYGLYQALLLVRLLPWIRTQNFTPSYWAFSFGVGALPTMAMLLSARGAPDAVGWLAMALFAMANVIVGWLVIETVRLATNGALLKVKALPA